MSPFKITVKKDPLGKKSLKTTQLLTREFSDFYDFMGNRPQRRPLVLIKMSKNWRILWQNKTKNPGFDFRLSLDIIPSYKDSPNFDIFATKYASDQADNSRTDDFLLAWKLNKYITQGLLLTRDEFKIFKRLLILTILNDRNIELHIPTIITRLEIKIIFRSWTFLLWHNQGSTNRQTWSKISKFGLILVRFGLRTGPNRLVWTSRL